MIITSQQYLDPFLTVTPLKVFKNNEYLYNATGFFFIKNQDVFLITNRHVLFFGKEDRVDKIVSKIHLDNNLKNNSDFPISIVKDKMYVPKNPTIDVVAIKLERNLMEKFNIYAFSDSNKPLMDTSEAENLGVVGYPLGIFDDVHNLPIIRRATLATKWNVNFKGLPCFLVDARLHGGMSGSPVILKPVGTMPSSRPNLSEPSESLTILFGIHSEEWPVDISKEIDVKDKPLDLNVVWYASVLDDLL